MRISTKGRYALRILADVATHGVGKNVSIREIAERQGISDKYLEGIVARLTSAGLLKSVRGKYGGYQLSKPVEAYNIYEILYAAEDSLALVSCLDDDADACPMMEECLTASLWAHLQGEFRKSMENVSLRDVMNQTFHSLEEHQYES